MDSPVCARVWYVRCVALGLKLRITNTRDNTVTERTFDRFPVRIGRNQLNDCQLDFPFVSQFHAVLELQGQKLMLRDLGSKNGTLLRGTGRVPPNTVVDLGSTNYEFAIVTLIFQSFAINVDTAQPPAPRKRHGTVLAMSMAEASNLASKASVGIPDLSDQSDPTAVGMSPPPPVPGPPQSMVPPPPVAPAAGATAAPLKPLYDGYRAAWAQLYSSIHGYVNNLDPQARAILLSRMASENAALANEPDFQRLAAHFGARVAPQGAVAQPAASREETVALQGLKELASWYLPLGRPVESVADVVGFLQKLQDTLDVFFKCFVPLRDGYKQFETQMDIKKTVKPPTGLVPAGTAVETARDPRELAQRLLDWRTDENNDGQRAVESTFADLMIHQVAMLNGVMKGVKSLLAELSPQAIERALEDPKRKGGGGIGIGPFRYKALWELYAERHSDLADEEKEAFALIFGPQFVSAYSQLAGEALGGKRGPQLSKAPGTVPPGPPGTVPPPGGTYPPPHGTYPPPHGTYPPPQNPSVPGSVAPPHPTHPPHPPPGGGPYGPPRR